MNRPPVLLDASHTSHTRTQTGIQRVCRSLYAALEADDGVIPVCFDPHLDAWRTLGRPEFDALRDNTGGPAGTTRGAAWSFGEKLAGHARRLTGQNPGLPEAHGLICPELFSPTIGARLTELIEQADGPCVAIFHDAIGLKYPELTPPSTVARLPAYLRELLQFDGIAAVSDDSAASLRDYWHWLGADHPPPVITIPHGVDHPIVGAPEPSGAPRVLSVGTIEGRKNHLALLQAAQRLWAEGLEFELELIGLARADTAGAALALIDALRREKRPLIMHGHVSDARLHAAYARCRFTVYPSLMEGFGLPVLESLRHGKPCVCSGTGALGESAHGGGCVALEQVDADALAHAMRRLLLEPAEVTRLALAARTRKFRTWHDCVADLTNWMATLPRRH